jgi:hypothetical protein
VDDTPQSDDMTLFVVKRLWWNTLFP